MNNSLSEKEGNTLETVTSVDLSQDTLIWTIDNFSVHQHDPNLELLIVNTLINSWTSTNLTIKCVLWYKIHNFVPVKENSELLPSNLPNISSFEQFYLSERLSDFSLKVDDEVLPVHRIVLFSHSSVFAAMIESDMKENHERFAVISDISSSVLKDMLHYMYCGMVEDLTPEKAILLYEAADIYNVQHLKEDCAVYLCNHMNEMMLVIMY
ncbi:speckle-type POZ protein [Trichonephila inaurata madagascariensis]|uniref:Speckle-type POZ protein n=1 Tax=Trichonephila inaurata madagascariensis TaxID=2747483 RepID=A0A8X6X467_9ARAC|nr:speckle-type POZ protein [Trichonephila inaurata madagascariensis]